MGFNPTISAPPRADLEKQSFEKLIFQKGREVIHEKTIQCPCKSKSTGPLSSCQNCGGSGWVYLNPKKTRMVITTMNVVTDTKAWSEESRGTINFTALDSLQVANRDRITVVDGMTIHSEVLHFKYKDGQYFAFSTYPVRKVLYSALYVDDSSVLAVIDPDDYLSFPYNCVVKIDESIIPEGKKIKDEGDQVIDVDLSMSIRYYHNPSFMVVELRRETMQSAKYTGGMEVSQEMPISGVARRLHYEGDAPNYNGERILNNDFEEITCTLDELTLLCSQIKSSGSLGFAAIKYRLAQLESSVTELQDRLDNEVDQWEETNW